MTQTELYQKLVSEYNVNPKTALTLSAIARAESALNPYAVGDAGKSIGLFQIYIPAHPDKLAKLTGVVDQNYWKEWLKNPDNNIKAALAVFESQGLGAWTMYKNKGYQQYLQDVNVSASPSENTTKNDNKEVTEDDLYWHIGPVKIPKIGKPRISLPGQASQEAQEMREEAGFPAIEMSEPVSQIIKFGLYAGLLIIIIFATYMAFRPDVKIPGIVGKIAEGVSKNE